MSTDRSVSIGPQARWYLPEALGEVPRLLGMMDREPMSPTYGSFDRDAWSWKFRDFPLGMSQTAVYPLALLWRHPFPGSRYCASEPLLEWIGAGMERAFARQHTGGAIDAFAPNEFDVGPTLGVAHGVAEALRLVGSALTPARRERLLDHLRRALDFALPRDETHGFISNHLALFAVAFQDGFELLGDERYRRRAEELVGLVRSGQSPEGWYREYDGPDPGYESLGIFHLATWWRRTGSVDLLRSLRRSVEFFQYFVHPDGSAGGAYGSRHTAAYYPGGFELLATECPAAASVARFMRERLGRRNAVGPAGADAPNLVPMLYTYLEACLADGAPDAGGGELPCQSLQGVRRFEDSGLIVAGAPAYYAVVGGAKGGVCRVFARAGGDLAYEDAGYLVRTADGLLTSQHLGLGHLAPAETGSTVTCEARFAEFRHEPLTPARLILLRLLNLTLFRVPALAGWFRRRIVARLRTARRPGPFRLRRTFEFGTSGIHVTDELERLAPVRVREVLVPRSFTGIHSGSAKYFLASDLARVAAPSLDGIAEAIEARSSARREFHIQPSSNRPDAASESPSGAGVP